MRIIISNSSPVPIYEQIKNIIINQIINNELVENEMLPSIRNLAKDIRISVMTVKKAYDELEKEGYIVVVQGKGAFVAKRSASLIEENAKKELENHIIKALDISKKYNISKKEIIDLINILEER